MPVIKNTDLVELVRKRTGRSVEDIAKQLEKVSKMHCKVGYLKSNKSIRKAQGDSTNDIKNAQLAYIHENGSPVRGIPARPFLKPAVESTQQEVRKIVAQGLHDELLGQTGAVEYALNHAGSIVRDKAMSNIVNQVGFAPLADSTLKARKRKGNGNKGGFAGTKALIATGQLLNALHWEVNKK